MDHAGLSFPHRRLFFTWGKRALGSLLGLLMNVCKQGPSDSAGLAVLLGRAPLLQESELFPWPAVAVPTSGGEGMAAREPRGIAQAEGSCGAAVALIERRHADAASTLPLTPGYPKPK